MQLHTDTEHAELRALSEHLLYEIEMLEHDASRLMYLLDVQDVIAQQDRSAFLESFLLHVRNLYEFLFSKKGKEDKNALRANDFMEDKPYLIPEPDSELKKWAKEMINKRLVHLSQHRLSVKEADSKWKFGILFNQIYQQLLEFYEWVEDEHICEQLRLRKGRALHDAYGYENAGGAMLGEWTCDVVMSTGSPSVPVVMIKPIGFPIERSCLPDGTESHTED